MLGLLFLCTVKVRFDVRAIVLSTVRFKVDVRVIVFIYSKSKG